MLDPLWDRVIGIVAREKDGPVGPLITGLHSWVYPGTLSASGGSFEASERAIRGVARRVVEQLAAVLAEHPGMLRRLSSYGAVLDLDVAVPPEFEILFPKRPGVDVTDFDDWRRRADAAVVALAQDVKSRPLEDQIELLYGSDVEAGAVGISYPRLTPRLAEIIAESNTDPLTWTDRLVRREASADLVLPFLRRSVEVDDVGWQDVLAELLGSDSYLWIALQVILTHPVGEDLKAKGIAKLGWQHRNMIEFLLARGEVDTKTVEGMLDAADPIVARDSAVAIAHGAGKTQLSDLSEAGQARWREVFMAGPPDEFWYSEILKRDPDLFAEWLRSWFARLEGSFTDQWFLPHTLLEVIGGLTPRVRRDLIEAIPADTPSYPLQDVVTELVGADLNTAEALLDRSDLKDIHWVYLQRGPSEPWMERALMALDRGWEPESIVRATTYSESGWSGEESHHWQKSVDAFSELDRMDDERHGKIIDAGVKVFSKFRDRAAASEREERVFGAKRRRW